MVFTAVLAAIAVIAAMVTVPGSKAGAAEPTDFTPNVEMGGRVNVGAVSYTHLTLPTSDVE